MSVKWEAFVGKAPVITAIRLTEDNIEEVAAKIGAEGYLMEKDLETNRRKITFTKKIKLDGEPPRYHHEGKRIVTVVIGDWLVCYPETVNRHAGERDAYFYSLTQDDIDKFVKQQKEKGEIDVEPAERDW